MPAPHDNIPEDVLKETVANSGGGKKAAGKPKSGAPAPQANGGLKPGEHRQRRIFKRKRGGVVLSREEVKEIKKKRRELRRDMRSRGIRKKRDFELVAGSMGYYFDKRRGFLFWLAAHWLGLLIALLVLLIIILLIFSAVTKLRGHFTINLSDGLFKEGFVLSETVGFENPTTELFASPAENVPCISIKTIPKNVDEIDGEHNGEYFAYTYYIRNDGENTVGYEWSLVLNSEGRDLSSATWLMLFEDGVMRFYAERNKETGQSEVLPPRSMTDKGYLNIPVFSLAPESDQFELIKVSGGASYYRIVPYLFESDDVIARGMQSEIDPGDVHKYTVVLWLEGDDPDTDDTKIGGHLGVEMDFRLVLESVPEENGWTRFWKSFKFWD